ncbi:MAG: polysaccharide deacetylase family protein [Bacteroidota bacterium]
MRTVISFILILSGTFSFGQKKQVCFTFDDLPAFTLSFGSNEFQRDLLKKTLLTLNKHRIPAIGFVNEFKLFNTNKLDTSKIKLLTMWLDAGIDLGNHTFSHIDYVSASSKKYCDDIIRGEKITRPLMKSYGKSLTYFRHPYLHIGESQAKVDSLQAFLASQSYIEAPATMVNSDWLFAYAYDSAMVKRDTALMKYIGISYVAYMEQKLKYFERQSIKLFERNIKHVLLIHASILNADYLDELIEMYERHNYEFISLEQALTDKAYSTKITAFYKDGISWLYRWALSMGRNETFFTDDPKAPDYIKKLAKTTFD